MHRYRPSGRKHHYHECHDPESRQWWRPDAGCNSLTITGVVHGMMMSLALYNNLMSSSINQLDSLLLRPQKILAMNEVDYYPLDEHSKVIIKTFKNISSEDSKHGITMDGWRDGMERLWIKAFNEGKLGRSANHSKRRKSRKSLIYRSRFSRFSLILKR